MSSKKVKNTIKEEYDDDLLNNLSKDLNLNDLEINTKLKIKSLFETSYGFNLCCDDGNNYFSNSQTTKFIQKLLSNNEKLDDDKKIILNDEEYTNKYNFVKKLVIIIKDKKDIVFNDNSYRISICEYHLLKN